MLNDKILRAVVTTVVLVLGTWVAFLVPDHWVNLVWLIEFGASLAACVVFMVLYHVRSRGLWRRSPLGRNIMGLVAAMFAIMGISIARAVFGDYPGRRTLLMMLFGVLTWFLWDKVLRLEQIFRDAHRVSDQT